MGRHFRGHCSKKGEEMAWVQLCFCVLLTASGTSLEVRWRSKSSSCSLVRKCPCHRALKAWRKSTVLRLAVRALWVSSSPGGIGAMSMDLKRSRWIRDTWKVEWTGPIDGLEMGVREREESKVTPAFFFFLFDCEDIDAVYSKWKKSYFKYINFEILLDSQVYMSGRELV